MQNYAIIGGILHAKYAEVHMPCGKFAKYAEVHILHISHIYYGIRGLISIASREIKN